MRVIPGRPASAITEEWPEPEATDERPYLLESVLVGLCGTDRELLHRPMPAEHAITIGHESLARVLVAPPNGRHQPGDLVVGVIRRACSLACRGCAIGRFDLCTSRPIVERGIYSEDGFGSDRWVASEAGLIAVPAALGECGVLVEPLTSLVKARRRCLSAQDLVPSSARDQLLVSGAGPIGLLGAWHFGQVFEGVTIVDPDPDAPAIAARDALSHVQFAHSWREVEHERFDAFLECSGSTEALGLGLPLVLHGGVVVLEGICGAHDVPVPSRLIQTSVLNDLTILATVNASSDDHEAAVKALLTAPPEFLDALISSEIAPEDWPGWARGDHESGVKTVVRFGS